MSVSNNANNGRYPFFLGWLKQFQAAVRDVNVTRPSDCGCVLWVPGGGAGAQLVPAPDTVNISVRASQW